jgi:hypothetical protein
MKKMTTNLIKNQIMIINRTATQMTKRRAEEMQMTGTNTRRLMR